MSETYASTLRRADKLYIKYWGAQVPQSQRKSLKEMAEFFKCSTKSIRKVLQSRGPYFTKWELERLGLERRYYYPGLNGRQLKPAETDLTIAKYRKMSRKLTEPMRMKMMQLRDEENMPFKNIALRFDTDPQTVNIAIAYQRQYLRTRDWGWIEK